MSEVTLARTADQHQRDAFTTFTELVQADPALTMQVFGLYEQQGPSPVDSKHPLSAEEEHTLGAIVLFFDTGSDGYVNFGPENDRASERARNTWIELSHASRAQTASEAAAKRAWRLLRVELYIASVLASQQQADQDAHTSSQLAA